MAKDRAQKEEIVEELVEAKPKKKKFFLIVVILMILLAGGGAGWYFLQGDKTHSAEEKTKKVVPPVYEKLEQFTVNLAGGERYLQVEISLKIADPKVGEEIKLHMPEIRDVLLRLLSSKQAEDISSVEGKRKLSEEIRSRTNQVLGIKSPQNGVLAVLFLAFIIQ